MLHHFHDKEPVGEQIEQMVINNAALEMLKNSGQKEEITPVDKNTKIKRIIFIILAVVIVLGIAWFICDSLSWKYETFGL